MAITLIFPGQGSQAIGMGLDFYNSFATAKAVFDEVDDALNQKLSKIIFEGDTDQLTLTENTQPALMAVSMAIVRTVEHEMGKSLHSLTAYMAGHSLGEYTANCAASTFTLKDTARLLKLRGQAMQRAVPVGKGAMTAILGLEIEAVESLTKQASLSEDDLCVVANDNSPGQLVASGHKTAIDRIIELALKNGAKRALPLPVSAPFHSPLMQPAACEMADALADTIAQHAKVPIIANVTTAPVLASGEIKSLLIEQVTGRVRWRESMATLQDLSVTHVVEVGSGKVLTGLIKRIDPGLTASFVNTIADLDAFIKLLDSKK
ncbi:ACP S-malonyltransferase [Candidatus Paracaedibacter symbiosus]|uniref:ACP S-malonyltransferase n=1 Tax=Candidatus Paracaedibacter symbiosus TaxID=244582 RepID=UPI000509E94E|nr:ACP S-malonyltransferase [Candidatus Paracaedibacter symbiosus]